MRIENENYCLEVIEAGGEIQSFFDKQNQLEFMWQGDKAYWSGKNPTLFPIVGNTFSKSYEWKGKTYEFKNHGFIRNSKLTCVQASEDKIVMELKANEETLARYPFDFTYQISYQLIGNKVEIVYTITNESDEVMPFSFGLHPGFRCPLLAGEKFSDYQLVFPQEEHMTQLVCNDEAQKQDEKHFDAKAIGLDYDLIKQYATLVYRDVKSPYVDLVGPKHSVRVGCLGYKYLCVWTAKEGAPFVCIEPWHGHGDFYETNCAFDEREDTMKLLPKQSFTTSYFIECN